MVRTRNPFQPSNRFIYLFHCSTHDLKNIRNALYKSWIKKDGARELLDSNGVKIGKGVVEKCFQKDRQREIDNLAPVSDVKEAAIVLNDWLVMNVSLAKSITSEKNTHRDVI